MGNREVCLEYCTGIRSNPLLQLPVVTEMAMDASQVSANSMNSTDPPRPTETEDNLVDDKLTLTPDFKGATLELDTAAHNGTDPDVKFAGIKGGARSDQQAEVDATNRNEFDRNRPGSTIGRKSVTSTGSKASLSATRRENNFTVQQYFSKKVSHFLIVTGRTMPPPPPHRSSPRGSGRLAFN